MRLSAQIEFDKIIDLDTTNSKVVVGRSSQCDLIIPHDAISRQHCLIEYEGTSYFITDLESSNGVFVNGRKLSPHIKTLVPAGAALALGTINCEIKETPQDFTASQIVSTNQAGDYTETIRVARIDLQRPAPQLELEKLFTKKSPRNPIVGPAHPTEPEVVESKTPHIIMLVILITAALVWYFRLYEYLK